jgi:RND family efflux transporter MFP subunit
VSEVGTPELHYLDGHVEAVNESTLSAQTSGVIEKLFYDVDDFVEPGKVIARIKSKNQQAGVEQAQASLDEAQARYTEAQADFKRISDIYAKRLVPKADYDASQAGMKAAEARLAAAKAQVTQAGEQLGYTSLIAPFGGIVTKRHVQLGEAVNPGTPIMTGISLDQMRVVVEVPQRLIGKVRDEKKAFVFQDGSNKSLTVKSLTFFPYADPKTNAFKVRIDLAEGSKDLFPGMFVKVAFVVGEQQGIVSVPESAVVVRSEVIGVYVINAQGKPALRQIRLGKKLDDNTISVLAGLDAGETIAIDPGQAAIFLKQQTGEKHDE